MRFGPMVGLSRSFIDGMLKCHEQFSKVSRCFFFDLSHCSPLFGVRTTLFVPISGCCPVMSSDYTEDTEHLAIARVWDFFAMNLPAFSEPAFLFCIKQGRPGPVGFWLTTPWQFLQLHQRSLQKCQLSVQAECSLYFFYLWCMFPSLHCDLMFWILTPCCFRRFSRRAAASWHFKNSSFTTCTLCTSNHSDTQPSCPPPVALPSFPTSLSDISGIGGTWMMGWQRVTQSCCIGQEKKSAYLHIPARHLLQLSIIPVVCKGRGDSMTNQPSSATQQPGSRIPGFCSGFQGLQKHCAIKTQGHCCWEIVALVCQAWRLSFVGWSISPTKSSSQHRRNPLRWTQMTNEDINFLPRCTLVSVSVSLPVSVCACMRHQSWSTQFSTNALLQQQQQQRQQRQQWGMATNLAALPVPKNLWDPARREQCSPLAI